MIKIKTTPWITLDGYSCFRAIEGTDPNEVKNRVAFIEKTARIRISPYDDSKCWSEDYKKWRYGPRGVGGSGNAEKEEIYGFYPPCREWCDKRLILLGYELG